MINWVCGRCRKETEHRIKDTGLEGYQNYKILICQSCGEKTMVPENALEDRKKVAVEKEKKVANDGGFDRDVGSDCESGICPVR